SPWSNSRDRRGTARGFPHAARSERPPAYSRTAIAEPIASFVGGVALGRREMGHRALSVLDRDLQNLLERADGVVDLCASLLHLARGQHQRMRRHAAVARELHAHGSERVE